MGEVAVAVAVVQRGDEAQQPPVPLLRAPLASVTQTAMRSQLKGSAAGWGGVDWAADSNEMASWLSEVAQKMVGLELFPPLVELPR